MRLILTIDLPPIGQGWLDHILDVAYEVMGELGTKGYGQPRVYTGRINAREWTASVEPNHITASPAPYPLRVEKEKGEK